jgi:hypothetical protein
MSNSHYAATIGHQRISPLVFAAREDAIAFAKVYAKAWPLLGECWATATDDPVTHPTYNAAFTALAKAKGNVTTMAEAMAPGIYTGIHLFTGDPLPRLA